MNIRVALHVLQAVAAAIAGGTIAFAGLDQVWTDNIVQVAALVVIGISTYMAATTSGFAKTPMSDVFKEE